MRAIRANGARALGIMVLVALSACVQRVWVMVPPHFDLDRYERIGLVQFDGAAPALCRTATQQFQQMLLAAQPGARIVELDSERLDPGAIREVAQANGVDAVFVGSVQVTQPAASFDFGASLIEVRARAEIRAAMTARLTEAGTGATVRAQSCEDAITIASAALDSGGAGRIGVIDPGGTQSQLVRSLASALSKDFRPHYYRKKPEDVPPGYRVTYEDGSPVYVPPALSSAGR